MTMSVTAYQARHSVLQSFGTQSGTFCAHHQAVNHAKLWPSFGITSGSSYQGRTQSPRHQDKSLHSSGQPVGIGAKSTGTVDDELDVVDVGIGSGKLKDEDDVVPITGGRPMKLGD